MRSVWSRVGIRSMTVVGPSALRPARRIADFTCALATSGSISIPRSAPEPRTTSGAWPSVVSTSAPMRRSGAATRSIGRGVSDSSPVSVNSPSCPARTPVEQAHERPRVAAVDRAGAQPAQARRPARRARRRRRPRPRRRARASRPPSPACRRSGRSRARPSPPRRARRSGRRGARSTCPRARRRARRAHRRLYAHVSRSCVP